MWIRSAKSVLLIALATAPSVAAASPSRTGNHYVVAATGPSGPASGWRGIPPSPPPPARVEHVRPRRGFVWIEGNYEWRDGRYVWSPGHFERARPGQRWHAGRWDRQHDRYAWTPGGWVAQGAYAPQPPPVPVFPVSIEGRVQGRHGRPLAGITVVLAGTSEARAVTDGDGRYVFTGLTPGSYAVRPTEARCGFSPDVINLNNLSGSAVQDFTARCR